MSNEKLSLYAIFEDRVTIRIEEQAEATRSDAQAIVEAHEGMLMNGFLAGDMPENVAALILQN